MRTYCHTSFDEIPVLAPKTREGVQWIDVVEPVTGKSLALFLPSDIDFAVVQQASSAFNSVMAKGRRVRPFPVAAE